MRIRLQMAILIATMIMAALAFTPGAHAANRYCAGTVKSMMVNANGDVIVLFSWHGNFVTICNLKESRLSVSPAICAAWYSQTTNAMKQKTSTTTVFANTNATCDKIPIFNLAPAVAYMLFNAQ